MCFNCGPDASDTVIDHSITHPFELTPNTDYECQTCGQHVSAHPDKMDFLAKHTMETIIQKGHQVMVIFGNDPVAEPGFFYTVGRTVKDRPELLLTGSLPAEVGSYILNRVADLDDESPISAGQELDEVLDGYPVRVVQVRDLKEAAMYRVVDNFGTDDTTALQILWPDAEGRFPGEQGYIYGDAQPVYA